MQLQTKTPSFPLQKKGYNMAAYRTIRSLNKVLPQLCRRAEYPAWATQPSARWLRTSCVVQSNSKHDLQQTSTPGLKEPGKNLESATRPDEPAERSTSKQEPITSSNESESATSALQAKSQAIRQALKEGSLGMGFSAGGFLYCYHLGVLWELARLGILPPPGDPGAIKMAGSSAGSLAIATFACGLDVNKATEALFEFAANCRTNGTRGRLGALLQEFLHAYLPDDAHERCRDLTYVHVTRVFPVWRPEVVHHFHNKDDLVQALITSCHIPYYANGDWMTRFRGRYYVDGGVASFIPKPPTPTVVKVCCFPVSQVLATVQPSVQGYKKVAQLLDVAISPDAFEAWPYSYQQLLNWALVPADDEILKYLISKGRKDAAAWASQLSLVSQIDGKDTIQAVHDHSSGQRVAEQTYQTSESLRRSASAPNLKAKPPLNPAAILDKFADLAHSLQYISSTQRTHTTSAHGLLNGQQPSANLTYMYTKEAKTKPQFDPQVELVADIRPAGFVVSAACPDASPHIFEGSEKRIEVDFSLGAGAPSIGLRAFSRAHLDELMTLAACTIVSSRSNNNFDAYVLSESSLFVYPTKWVLKTCGTTKLLGSVPRLLELAAEHGMSACRCKFTRASFLFPENQPSPHSGFEEEVAVLNQAFGHLQPDGQGQAYVLGEEEHGLQWHVYVAGRSCASQPTFNLEMCMTELSEDACKNFFRNEKFISSAQTTKDTGIINLLPGAVIDDYVFEPCGYSMNGIFNHQFITIHVTPESGFSYASVEISGHFEDLVDCSATLQAAINIFKPAKVSVAMSVDDANAPLAASWGTLAHLPERYAYKGANGCKLTCGGRVVYYTLEEGLETKCSSPASPKTVLHHSVSFLSSIGGINTAASDTGSEPASMSDLETPEANTPQHLPTAIPA